MRNVPLNLDTHGMKPKVPLLRSDEFLDAFFTRFHKHAWFATLRALFRAFYRRSLVLMEVIFDFVRMPLNCSCVCTRETTFGAACDGVCLARPAWSGHQPCGKPQTRRAWKHHCPSPTRDPGTVSVKHATSDRRGRAEQSRGGQR